MSRIVVGTDGSDRSRRAIRFALEEARLRDADLEVVHAIPEPYMIVDPVISPPPPREGLREAGLELVERSMSGLPTQGVTIEPIAAFGNPSQVLCEVAQGADLLVVATRGLGGFRGLLLGSVTQQVVAHASCPVLVVVPEEG
jgi:nucleotide-binding universal stress UspA family protein